MAPFQLLYVLHTTRTGAELGRYESPELNSEAVRAFLDSFGRFLSEDARQDAGGKADLKRDERTPRQERNGRLDDAPVDRQSAIGWAAGELFDEGDENRRIN